MRYGLSFLNTFPLTILFICIKMNIADLIGVGEYNVVSGLPLLFVLFAVINSDNTVDKHLEMGKKFLATGQFADALTHYHAAVDGDPKNYLTFYRRATVYLAMGKSKSAMPDLDKVIELRPTFVQARVQRANVKLKQGKLIDAREDYRNVVKIDQNHQQANEKLNIIPQLLVDHEEIDELMENDMYADETIERLTKAIEFSPWDSKLRKQRSRCYSHINDHFNAIQDYRSIAKLEPDNTDAYYSMSLLYYQMTEPEDSLKEIRECLKLDADHKLCMKHYKKVKKLVKQLTVVQEKIQHHQWAECINKANLMYKTEPQYSNYIRKTDSFICQCYSKGEDIPRGIEACTKIIDYDANHIDALCYRAELYISKGEFELGLNDYQTAAGVAPDLQKVKEGVNRARKLLKNSKKRDYYKILNVKRSSRKPEIMRAYRKLAMKWHPDKFSEADKAEAQSKFMDIAAAKEVLTDKEKRAQYDAGVDPLDAEQQAEHNQQQQWQGFDPFENGGGGGGGFKFHFN